MQEVGPVTDVYSGIAHELDETEVTVLFRSTAQAKAERKRLAEGCCDNVFHQTCLKRRREASKDNRWTTTRTVAGSQGDKEHVAKDILHHCCAKCVKACTGSEETRYADHHDGFNSKSHAECTKAIAQQRRDDKLASAKGINMNAMVQKLSSLGKDMTLLSKSRAGKVKLMQPTSLTDQIRQCAPADQAYINASLKGAGKSLSHLANILPKRHIVRPAPSQVHADAPEQRGDASQSHSLVPQ
ncbi:hypothetical protein MMC08_007445 [Hypocenomyce scalaris]|nr:hypothetical protein [Hypocenomyce scalaris]